MRYAPQAIQEANSSAKCLPDGQGGYINCPPSGIHPNAKPKTFVLKEDYLVDFFEPGKGYKVVPYKKGAEIEGYLVQKNGKEYLGVFMGSARALISTDRLEKSNGLTTEPAKPTSTPDPVVKVKENKIFGIPKDQFLIGAVVVIALVAVTRK